MKKLFFLFLMVSVSLFAQEEKKLEHGLLIGGGAGFAVQNGQGDDFGTSNDSYWNYRHDYKLNGMLGYRLRFLPEQKFFYDLDLTLGFQKMETYKTCSPYLGSDIPASDKNETLSEFVMPVSLAASWNWRFTKRFFVGLGVSPMLYVQPQPVFDLSVMAKVGYRVSRRCELAVSYQYGCLNSLQHFNEGLAAGRHGHLMDLMLSVYVPF